MVATSEILYAAFYVFFWLYRDGRWTQIIHTKVYTYSSFFISLG